MSAVANNTFKIEKMEFNSCDKNTKFHINDKIISEVSFL